MPQRTANGYDYKRAQMLLAVLEKHLGAPLRGSDVFVNIAGGVQIDEPAGDLGVAAAIMSSYHSVALDAQTLFIGEIGLSGEIRTVSQCDRRLAESVKLGFHTIILPKQNVKSLVIPKNVHVIGVDSVAQAMEKIF